MMNLYVKKEEGDWFVCVRNLTGRATSYVAGIRSSTQALYDSDFTVYIDGEVRS